MTYGQPQEPRSFSAVPVVSGLSVWYSLFIVQLLYKKSIKFFLILCPPRSRAGFLPPGAEKPLTNLTRHGRVDQKLAMANCRETVMRPNWNILYKDASCVLRDAKK